MYCAVGWLLARQRGNNLVKGRIQVACDAGLVRGVEINGGDAKSLAKGCFAPSLPWRGLDLLPGVGTVPECWVDTMCVHGRRAEKMQLRKRLPGRSGRPDHTLWRFEDLAAALVRRENG